MPRKSEATPRIVGAGSSKLLLSLLVVVLLFAFTPIERALTASVNGSFAQSPYTSLAFASPTNAATGFFVGQTIRVNVTNSTGQTETYHWSATQGTSLISLGEISVEIGRTAVIRVPTQGASPGTLRIALTGTGIFVSVLLLKS